MNKIILDELKCYGIDELFYKGNLNLLQKPRISIVGSRNISVYTKNILTQITQKLSKLGICIVSGGAIGTDILAAKYSYPNTIAVFANNLNEIYPLQNKKLICDIYENALAFSEKKPNEKLNKWDFLSRNRIVVGLGEFLIIAQADLKSGSLNSAKHAINQNKKIFVLPQKIGESDGTNKLLAQNKASLIYDIDEFIKWVQNYFKLDLQNDLMNEDEFLSNLNTPKTLDEMLLKYGDKVYEYELLGHIRIDGVMVIKNNF